jgi:hypothetical protein
LSSTSTDSQRHCYDFALSPVGARDDDGVVVVVDTVVEMETVNDGGGEKHLATESTSSIFDDCSSVVAQAAC